MILKVLTFQLKFFNTCECLKIIMIKSARLDNLNFHILSPKPYFRQNYRFKIISFEDIKHQKNQAKMYFG